jgi:protein-arginine kinase activator protein McsA
MRKAKKRVFSVVKAVKENARDRVGAPPQERVLPDPKQKAAKPKHKETLADLLEKQEHER